jgi:D-serine deaminase-like pyridoxal phosphate-dependent protein
MARLARNARTQLQVVVDVEVGLKRCGVRPGEAAVRLAKIVLENGLKLRGLMGYEGHLQQIPPGPEKEAAIKSSLQPLIDCKCLLEREGIPVEIVTCGGTGTSAVAATIPGVTEIQAGSYLLMETNYAKFVPQFKVSLSVLTSVISKTPGERIVVDAGIKALSTGRGMPSVKSIGGLQLHALHAEHGLIAIEDPSVAVEVGDKIEIWVHYADGTLQLHNQMYGIRNGEVEEVFKIEA